MLNLDGLKVDSRAEVGETDYVFTVRVDGQRGHGAHPQGASPGLDETCQAAFADLITAMCNWREEIFAYFDLRVTNAYTEAINGIARIVNRAGRGYSFEVLRAKMLLNYANHRMVWGGGMAMATEPKMFRQSLNEAPVPYYPSRKKLGIRLPLALGVPFWKLQHPEKMDLHQPRILDEKWLSEF